MKLVGHFCYVPVQSCPQSSGVTAGFSTTLSFFPEGSLCLAMQEQGSTKLAVGTEPDPGVSHHAFNQILL